MGLHWIDPRIQLYFCPVVGELWRATLSYTQIFDYAGIGTPNPMQVQWLAVQITNFPQI